MPVLVLEMLVGVLDMSVPVMEIPVVVDSLL
jgi:hypothetical protein